jgi:hypothetical protein
MDEDSIYVPTRNAAYRRIGEEVVIVDTANNRMMTLNNAGSVIWMMLDGSSVGEIADAVVRSFRVNRARAIEDVIAFLGEMKARGLVAAQPGETP